MATRLYDRSVALLRRTIASAMVLGLVACQRSGERSVAVSQCYERWTADGAIHDRFVLTNSGTKKIASVQVFLGAPGGPRPATAQVQALGHAAFVGESRDFMEFDDETPLDAGASQALAVRSTFRRPIRSVPIAAVAVGCFIGGVTYRDGTGWTQGHLEVQGLSKPYFVKGRL